MILQEAILHIPLSQYAFANSEMNLTIRIRVAKDNLTDCVLWYGDRVQPGDPIVFTAVYMKKILSDMHFDYYDATFETPYDRVCYYFELKDPEESRFYYADICAKYFPLERRWSTAARVHFAFPVGDGICFEKSISATFPKLAPAM